jgi:OFA family oxalate/formate antiporter-like MFS transporter
MYVLPPSVGRPEAAVRALLDLAALFLRIEPSGMSAVRASSCATLQIVAPDHQRSFDEPAEAPCARSGQFFYGWLMVAVTSVVLVSSSPGQTFGFTYFNPWLRRSLGLSQTELSATYLLATLLAALPLGFVGALADRVGLKRSMLATVAAMGGACLLSASVTNVPTLFVAFVAMRMFGPGVMTLLANNTLAAWFDLRLGLASSVVQMVMAAAMAVVPLALMGMIAAVGWRETYAVLGAILVLAVLPLVWQTYRECPDDVGQQRDGGWTAPAGQGDLLAFQTSSDALAVLDDEASFDLATAVRTRAFWILLAATSVWSMIGTGLVFHLDGLLASRGLSALEIAWTTPLMAVCMAATQLAGGRLADRVAPGRLAAVALAMEAGTCVMFATTGGILPVAAYGVFGAAQGVMSLVSSTVWTRYFGRRHLGKIRGTTLTVAISASAMGPLVMGVSFDYFGGFDTSMWAFAAAATALAMASPWATRPEAMCACECEAPTLRAAA